MHLGVLLGHREWGLRSVHENQLPSAILIASDGEIICLWGGANLVLAVVAAASREEVAAWEKEPPLGRIITQQLVANHMPTLPVAVT